MKVTGNVITYIGLFLIFQAMGYSHNGGTYWPGFALGAAVALIGAGTAKLGANKTQAKGDSIAKRAFETKNFSGKALFLRTFENDGCFSIDRTGGNIFDWDQYDRPGDDSLERMLAEAFASSAVLVGAGGRGGSQFGAGTAGILEGDWKPAVSQAIATAEWIVLVPSANPGTLWELGEILKLHATVRTIFVMPPSVAPLIYSGGTTVETLWTRARLACQREFNLELPIYNNNGALFTLRGDRSGIKELAPFDMRSPRKLAQAINAVL